MFGCCCVFILFFFFFSFFFYVLWVVDDEMIDYLNILLFLELILRFRKLYRNDIMIINNLLFKNILF